MAIGREPSGAYEAAFPIPLPTGNVGYARAFVSVDQNGAPVSPGTGTSANQVQGTSAAGAPDDGTNPVKIGGISMTSRPVLSDGQRSYLVVGQRGQLHTTIAAAQGGVDVAFSDLNAPVDITSGSTRPLAVAQMLYNAGNGFVARGDGTSAFVKAPPLNGTDRSITASTTSQTLMPANASRSRILIRNDTTIDVWVNFGATAVATAGGGNFKIAASGGSLDLQGTSSALNIIAASGTPAISAREW